MNCFVLWLVLLVVFKLLVDDTGTACQQCNYFTMNSRAFDDLMNILVKACTHHNTSRNRPPDASLLALAQS